MPSTRGALIESSLPPLTKLEAPMLFVQPGKDPLCSVELLEENLYKIESEEVRVMELPVRGGGVRRCGKVWRGFS